MNLADFQPTDDALHARIDAIDPSAYARTRNHLDGRVTRLSPYLTHGLTNVPEVIARLRTRYGLEIGHKLIFELAWREYFHHLWARHGDAIFEDLRAPPGSGYREEVPDDLLRGRTGVPAVDQAVRALYDSGYLHNHARMWLASYAVHLRKVHWRAGADWMVGHLLDGDLASNHLSWQWVAGTMTGKPYLFNAENVARYAPRWASPGTAIDREYADLERIARSGRDVGPQTLIGEGIETPPLLPASDGASLHPREPALPEGRIALLHPWSLAAVGDTAVDDAAVDDTAVGIIVTEYHQRWPWSPRRWDFVLRRLRALAPVVLIGTQAQLAAQLDGRACSAGDTLNPYYRDLLRALNARLTPAPRFFENPDQPCRSFSQFWQRVQKQPPLQ